MVYVSKFAAVAAVYLASSVAAHPGEHHDHAQVKREIVARDQMAAAGRRSLDNCSGSVAARQLHTRNLARRAETARALRAKRDIQTLPKKYRRDLETLEVFEAINHNATELGYTIDTAESTVFGANTSCILAPENTIGPYYVTGELIRQDVVEDQAGIPMHLEIQYIDITTCEPIPQVYVDIWNCNATGIYSGVVATGNSPEGGWNSTFLRGVQATDEDGVATFSTIFPGHYDGRAIHTHLVAHTNVTLMENGTMQGGLVNHIGQLFYNEELRSAAELVYPYTENTQAVTSNADDMWSIVGAGSTTDGTAYDPYPEYLYLGDSIEDGLMAWIQVGINVTADQTSSSYYGVAGVLQADGGHSSGTSSVGGGGGSGGESAPNGTMGGNGTAPPS